MKVPLSSWMFALFCMTVHSTSAAASAYDGFDYPANAQLAGGNGGTGFSTAWSGDNSFIVAESSLFTGGATSGRHIRIAGNGVVTRQLSQTLGANGTVAYLSVAAQALYQIIFGPPKGADRVGVTLNGGAGKGIFLGKVANQFNWAMDNAVGGAPVAGPPMFITVPSAQVLLVIKCEFFAGNDRFTLYVNPVPGQPEPATGAAVKFDSDVGSISSVSFNVSNLEGSWGFDEIRIASTFAGAVPVAPANHAPTVAYQVPDKNATYGAPFTFAFPADVFIDIDPNTTLNYSATGQPMGLLFDNQSHIFNGAPASAGSFPVTVTVSDNGSPPMATNETFNIVVAKAPLVVSANNANRAFGEANPAFSGTITGVTNNDNITVSFDTSATIASPPGVYQITPNLLDPYGRLVNYDVTTNPGALTIEGVSLDSTLSNGAVNFCWPTSAGGFVLESAESLVPPISWQLVTSGIATNGATICATVTSAPAASQLFYRLHLP